MGLRGACSLAMIGMAFALAWAGGAHAAEGRRLEISKNVAERGMEPPTLAQPPARDSVRGRALAALAASEGPLTLYSLQPYEPLDLPTPQGRPDSPKYLAQEKRNEEPSARSERDWCKRAVCLGGNKVLGKVAVTGKADRAHVSKALRESLGKVPEAVSLCHPEYRHAIAFVSGGKRYEVLLCYQCQQVRVIVDGDVEGSVDEQADAMGDQRALNAILRKGGIALANVPEESSEE